MDKNMTLEKRIDAELYSYQGRMSVFVDDLRGNTVEIGADEEFETASTIKAFILAVLYLQASRGRADLEEDITYEASQFVDGSGMLRALGVGAKLKVKDTATMMIICSDNIATNMIIDYLGLDTINACIRELGFGHTVLHNPLHFDRYDKLGTTTPRDYAALFAQVAKGTLVSREASAAMPKAQGMAISILNLMVRRILYMTSVWFFWARERTMLGIMEVPREEATATGTLESRRYLPP